MIVAVTADTHGKTGLIAERLKDVHPDYLLFAGDFYQDGHMLSRFLGVPASVVAGNCDFGQLSHQEQVVSLGAFKILLVHGHQYGVKKDLTRLYYRGLELQVDAIVFGHTHNPWCEKVGNMWMINPGSPVMPRWDSPGSFALINIDSNGLQPQILHLGKSCS